MDIRRGIIKMSPIQYNYILQLIAEHYKHTNVMTDKEFMTYFKGIKNGI